MSQLLTRVMDPWCCVAALVVCVCALPTALSGEWRAIHGGSCMIPNTLQTMVDLSETQLNTGHRENFTSLFSNPLAVQFPFGSKVTIHLT